MQALATKLHKIKNEVSPEIFTKIFARATESHYNLRRCNNVRISLICTLYHGSESVSFVGPKIWNILPDEIKQQISLNSFKRSLKTGSRKIARVDCAKFILMVSVSFLSCVITTQRFIAH